MNRRMTTMPTVLWAMLLLLGGTAIAQSSDQKQGSQSSTQSQSQSQQQSKQQKQVSGTVVRSENVQIQDQGRDTEQQNRVILLQTQDGQHLVIDLGPEEYLQHVRLLPGTHLKAQGRIVRMGDRAVLLAQQIETQGQSLRVQRP